jgi:meiotic recombination protein SPO11
MPHHHRQNFSADICRSIITLMSYTSSNIIQQIETLCEKLIDDIANGRISCIRIARGKMRDSVFKSSRSKSFGIISMFDIRTAVLKIQFSGFSQTVSFLKVMAAVHELLYAQQSTTKRDVYYAEPSFFGRQDVVDGHVENLAALFKVPRVALSIVASHKGKVFGDLTFTSKASTISCNNAATGTLIPPYEFTPRCRNTFFVFLDYRFFSDRSLEISRLRAPTIRFVLVIEKDATFYRCKTKCMHCCASIETSFRFCC